MYNKKTRQHKKRLGHKKTRKIKGGNVNKEVLLAWQKLIEDCTNKDGENLNDPITLEPLTSSDIIIKFQPSPNLNKYNCYDRSALKTHILHQLNPETEDDNSDPVNNVRDPVSNIQVGRNFIETNFPEIDLPDFDDDDISNSTDLDIYLFSFTDILNEIELAEYDELETLYDEFDEQLHRINIDDNNLSEFVRILKEYVEEKVNDDNKTYELNNHIDKYIDDNSRISGGKKKKQFLYNPNDPKKSFDVYIDKDPSDTIHIKYTTMEDIKKTIRKLERLYKQHKYTHQRIWQVGMIMKVRLEALKKHHKTLYPKAKNVSKRYNLANKYFKFLSSRTKLPENKRQSSTFHFT